MLKNRLKKIIIQDELNILKSCVPPNLYAWQETEITCLQDYYIWLVDGITSNIFPLYFKKIAKFST